LNILYFHTHDTGKAIKSYGYNVPTENIFEFTKDATLFRNTFCAGPTCSPSRAALLTGTYPHKNGMLGLAHRGFELNDYSKHMASFFKENGYETIISGIQHEVGHYYKKSIENSKKLGYEKVLTTDHKKYEKEEDLYKWDFENTEVLIKYLKNRDKEKNFFASCGLFSTHRPYPIEIDNSINENYVKPLPNIYDNKENREDMAKFMTSAITVDKCFKKLCDTLKELEIYDETIIIFTTDHGVANPGMKCTLSDMGTGVSLIIRNPISKKSHGKTTDEIISHVDVFPTLCDILEIKKPEYLDGNSFKSLFEKEEKINEYVFSQINFHTSYEPARSIRNKRYKYIKYYDKNYNKFNYSNIDNSNPKDLLIDNGLLEKNKDIEQFYDLYFDPMEKNNLINDPKYKKIIDIMKSHLKNWQEIKNDPILKGGMSYPEDGKVNKKDCLSAGSKNIYDYEVHPELKK